MTRDELQECLRAELVKWSAIPLSELESRIRANGVYEVKSPGGDYQVEVQVLENTPDYLHVSVAVDGGGLSAFKPLTGSFIAYRDGRVSL